MAAPTTVAQVEEGVILVGVVRDFRTDHPDFNVSPALGPGHVAGNVETHLGLGGTPELGPWYGFSVADQWTNSDANPIAPHMYWVGPGATVPVDQAPTIDNKSYADTWDPSLGPYGGVNVGPAPDFVVGADMPTVFVPTNLPSPVGTWQANINNGSVTLDTDLDCQNFYINNHCTVFIDGNVTIVCRDQFVISNWGRIELNPGARLRIYVENVVDIQDQCYVGDPNDPSRVTIYNAGVQPIEILNQTSVFANVISPNAIIRVTSGSDFYGGFIGAGVDLKNQGGFHATGMPPSLCGFSILDAPGLAADESDGDVSSSSSFDQWFRNAPLQNAAAYYPITLLPLGNGFYEFQSDAFYPIDNELYGNQGQAHNLNFTFVLNCKFTFHACQDQILELEGSDDIWAAVVDDLIIDLGGIGANQLQVAEMDRLGLTDGETYNLRIFYAHRSPSSTPSFRVKTNLDLHWSSAMSEVPMHTGFD
jgi:fibro-slime domain-containing protein